MFAVTAARVSPEDPLAALHLGDHPEPVPPDGWATVTTLQSIYECDSRWFVETLDAATSSDS